jgi:hypothetical protein
MPRLTVFIARRGNMDFFAMILESVLDRVNAIFGPIQNPVLKAILQIIAMIVVCAGLIALVFLITKAIKG